MRYILLVLLFTTSLIAENYTRTLNPTPNVDQISKTSFLGEFDEIGRIINGNLETSNIKNADLLNEDFMADTITTASISNGTITPADFANLESIAAGSLIYATSLSTFGELALGSNTQVLQSDGNFAAWDTAPSVGWTDTGSILYPSGGNDINMSIGGTTVGTDGKAVVSLFNGTTPTTSVTDGIQLYSEEVTDTETVFLTHVDGDDGDQSATDDTGTHTINFQSTAQLDDAQKKFGTTSLNCDGNSDYIYMSDSDDWAMGTSDWTIDFWVRFNSDSQDHGLFGQYQDSNDYLLCFWRNSDNKIFFQQATTTFNARYSFTWNFSTDTWYHFEISRDSTNLRIFIDGVSQSLTADTAIGSNDLGNLTGDMRFGYDQVFGAYLNGWMDEIRFINGSAANTSNFTPPTSAYSIDASSELKVRDEAGNVTTLSPHNFKLIPGGKIQDESWAYYSYNESLGKEINVDMLNFVRKIEELSGKQFIYIRSLDNEN